MKIAVIQRYKIIKIFKNANSRFVQNSLLILVGFLLTNSAYSQNDSWNVDSLLQNVAIMADQEKVEAYNKIASFYQGIEDSVQYYTELAVKESKELNYEQGMADAFFIRGNNFSTIGKIDQSHNWLNAAMKIYSKAGNKSKISKCINSIGSNFVATSDYDSALITFNKVLFYADSIEIAYSYLNIGTLLENTGNDQKALEYCRKSVEIFEKYDDESGLAGNYLIISRVLSHQKEFIRALDYINKAIGILKFKGDRTTYANSLNELALLYSNTNKPQQAIRSYKEALRLNEELNYKDGIITVNFNLCLSYLHITDLTNTKYYYTIVDSLSVDSKDRFLKCDMLWLESEIEEVEGNLEKSFELLDESLKVAIELSSWTTISNLSKKLAKLNKAEGNFEKALEYKDIYINAKDSLMNVEMIKELERLRFSHDLSTIENELALQKAEVALLENEKRNARLTYGLVIAGSIFLIVFATFSFFRQRKINRIQKRAMDSEKAFMKISLEQEKLKHDRLNEVIVYKNKQLTDLAIHITEKNDLLERFKENIKSVKKSIQGKKVTGLLQDMLVNISQDIDMNKERLEFYKEIEDLNQTFLYTLSKRYPGLTDRELKLAALLRVNLATKRIAVLMGLSPISVDIYRHNLRKKIGLDKGTSLYDYFNKLED
ncbi:MAG: tetratricopeptide repeat protein [Bacteroidales bacterium]|nr:tetratricopeptide repeat protein [Bacteroidales bacterium]